MARSSRSLELWAGIECTRTRIADRRPDQLVRTGHCDRLEDLERIAALGIRTLRYPVLWEYVMPEPDASPDWAWADERLPVLRELGINPVVGLLHHGLGPGDRLGSDPGAVEAFAAYARSVAERYPWLDQWLPINEPLTTARFGGLYAVWHPHARDQRVFARLLVDQLRATVRAIEEIRTVNPDARFVQNEDLGTILSVPALREQAQFENDRRWSTFDLLTGRLSPGTTMWEHLRRYGIDEAELWWFHEHRCPPDVLALDHYVTSDRLLDDRMHRYPSRAHGGNGERCYADIEAVRATAEEPPGVLPLLREAWHRYGLPLSLGEVHLGSTREEQLRWLRDCWRAAEVARAEGADVRAVTVWALLGSYDWNSLLTREAGFYESGAFCLRAGEPRPTALGRMVRALASGEWFDHPALDADGWWRRDDRLLVPPVSIERSRWMRPPLPRAASGDPRRLVLAGVGRPVLDAFERTANVRALPTVRLEREHLAIEAADLLRDMRAWAVVDVGVCAVTARKRTVGDRRAAALARAAREAELPLVLVACAHTLHEPAGVCATHESDRAATARAIHDRVLVVRPGVPFTPWDRHDPLVRHVATGARAERPGSVIPAYLPDVASVALDLLIDEDTGTWDLHHGLRAAWTALEDAAQIARRGDDPILSGTPIGSPGEARWMPLPSLLDAISRFVAESEPLWSPAGTTDEAPDIVELGSGPGLRYPADEPAETQSPASDAIASADGAA